LPLQQQEQIIRWMLLLRPAPAPQILLMLLVLHQLCRLLVMLVKQRQQCQKRHQQSQLMLAK
jgi:hypothetical protein